MEAQPKLAQGEVKLGRHEQDKEGLLKGNPPVEQANANFHSNHSGADGADQFKYQSREEGHAQNPHGGQAVLIGNTGNLLSLVKAAPQGLEG